VFDVRASNERTIMSQEDADKLRPWRLGWQVDVLLGLFALGGAASTAAIVAMWPTLRATVWSKVLIVPLGLSWISGVVCTIMWRRLWQHVAWDVTFSQFVSAPPPEYPEALAAWRWGRRLRLSWWSVMTGMGLIAAIEKLAGNW
jgi:hypothetical protein